MWLFFLIEQITDGWWSESLELGLVLIKYRLRDKTKFQFHWLFDSNSPSPWGKVNNLTFPHILASLPTQCRPPTRTCQKKHEKHTESEEIWKMWRLEIGIDCLKLQNPLRQFTAKNFSNFPPQFTFIWTRCSVCAGVCLKKLLNALTCEPQQQERNMKVSSSEIWREISQTCVIFHSPETRALSHQRKTRKKLFAREFFNFPT